MEDSISLSLRYLQTDKKLQMLKKEKKDPQNNDSQSQSVSFSFLAGNYCLEVVVFMFHTWAICVCVFLLVICFNFFCSMLRFSLPMLLHVDLYFQFYIHIPQCVYLCLQNSLTTGTYPRKRYTCAKGDVYQEAYNLQTQINTLWNVNIELKVQINM